MDYVRNTWYPLTWSRDVGRALIKRRIVGEDVVLYRAESGGVVAMLDMCPHRMLPLSMGRLKGDAIECGYHGMTFNENGRCVRIPGQDRVGPKIGVKTFPVTERMGLVWIWLGAPELADPAKVFNLPEYDDPNWCFAHGDALAIGTNYLNLADNLCDPSHVSFVHQSTLGNASSQDIPVQSRDVDSGVLVWRWIRNAPAIPLFAKYGNFTGMVDRWHYYYYYAPSIAVIDFGTAPTGDIVDENDRTKGMQIFACHMITPVDEHSCIDHWMHVRNFSVGDTQLSERFHDDLRIAFNEDKEILEAIELKEAQYPNFKRTMIAIDAAPTRMRKQVANMIDAEKPRAA